MTSSPHPPTGTRNHGPPPVWRQRAGVVGGYLGLAIALCGVWLLLGEGGETAGVIAILAGAAVVTVAGVAFWNRAFGVPLLIGPFAAAAMLLVRYATSPADRQLGWALAAGIMLAIAVAMIMVARHGTRKMSRELALERDGIPALAEVLEIRETGRHSGLTPQVLLEVELTPEGRDPYREQRRLYVAMTKMPRPGDVLDAKVDPADPTRWSVDLEPEHWRDFVEGNVSR